MTFLQGLWRYRSYCPNPVSATVAPSAPAFETWSPEGIVTIDAAGASGTLEFRLPAPNPPLKLDLAITTLSSSPHMVSIKATGQGGVSFTNELVGWVVPADLSQGPSAGSPVVVRGAIVQTSAGLKPGSPPINSVGYFVLER